MRHVDPLLANPAWRNKQAKQESLALDLNPLLYLLLFLFVLGLSIYSVVRKRIDENRRRDEPDLSASETAGPEEGIGDNRG